MPEIKNEYSVKELAAMFGIKRQSLFEKATLGKWEVIKREKRQGGNLYPYATLPDDVKAAIALKMADEEPKKILPSGEAIPEKPKRIGLARYWLVAEWRVFRRRQAEKGKGKTTATAVFLLAYNSGKILPDIFETLGKTQKSTLYRWDNLLKEHGDDYQALCDRRGLWSKGLKKQGLGQLRNEAAEAFLAAWLTPNKPSVTLAYEVMAAVLKKAEPEAQIPSLASVYRFARRFAAGHYDLYLLKREGEKALNDKALPYIRRNSNLLEVGDCLFADGHTLNFECLHPETGKPFRPTLILWYDWKSGLPVGWEAMPTENTVAIAAALRMAIIHLGKFPKVAYLDNGRAFKSQYFTGEDQDFEALSGLYARLGVALQLARPYHGQSKVVERFFGTFNEQFSRLMPTYTGRDITDKPAWRLRNERYHTTRHEKNLGYPTLRQVMAVFQSYVTWFADKPHPRLPGRTHGEVFEAGRGPGVDVAELDRQFLWSKKVRPQRTGFTLAGVRYESDRLFGVNNEIIIRFSWADLSVIHLYDLDGEALGLAYPQEETHPLAAKMGDEHDRALVADHNRRYGRLKKETMRRAREIDGELAGQPGLTALPYVRGFGADDGVGGTAADDAGANGSGADGAAAPPLLSDEERAGLEALYEKAVSDMAARPKLERPPWFQSEWDKYDFFFDALREGHELTVEELAFMQSYEASEEYRNATGARYEQLKRHYGLETAKGDC